MSAKIWNNILCVLFPYGKCFLSAKYSMFSKGISFLSSRTTDRDPMPESNTATEL